MRLSLRLSLLLAIMLSVIVGCASRYEPSESYNEVVTHSPHRQKSKQTVVFFLIDGLSVSVLNKQLNKNLLPEIKNHFKTSPLILAHSVFPSLTFPNISSILRENSVDQTGAIGNSIFYNKKLIRFEEPADRFYFSEYMRGNNIFTRLKSQQQKTVSLDYGLGFDADVKANFDLNSALATGFQNYSYLDQKKIESLNLLLKDQDVDQWPEFIFIHIVGLDFISHSQGAHSVAAYKYLETLDRDLKPLFETLRAGERKGHLTVSMLSADHGFISGLNNYVPIENKIQQLDPEIKIINEGRFAALYTPTGYSSAKLEQLSNDLLKTKGIELVAFKKDNQVKVHSLKEFSYPFFLENLNFYFNAPKAPDLVVIADRRAVFLPGSGSSHGGPTAEETIVPLLLRNATMADPEKVMPLWQVFKFL
ncbi:hypothetical protein CIK05_08225 [Bdellovibrio sp. qaytius]|nr:hypothetical protein CIK05_08225 [Bdellovibrio sp. qaytius]